MNKTLQYATLAALMLVTLLFGSCMERDLNSPFDPTDGSVKPATPVFNPPGGAYTADQTVSITCSTPGATIRYTTNGSEPTESSTQYTTPLSVSENTTLKAKSFKSGWTPSSTATASYTFNVSTPTLNPSGGSYTSTQTVSITCSTPGATIRYTTNGSEPTESSTQYTKPLSVSENTTLKAKCFKSGWTPSSTAAASYTFNVSSPTFSPQGGTYTSAQNVTISCSTSGATIYYSTDGSTPSTRYTGPVNIASTATLKAKATKSGWTDSQIASAVYTIHIPTVATPTFRPPGGIFTSAQNVTISCSTSGATIYYSTDGSTPSTRYTGPVYIASTTNLKAKATKSGLPDSQIASAAYTINIPQTVATPTFSLPGGTYNSAQTVQISCATSGATIRYTTNGTEPTQNSSIYSNPINVSSTTTLRAKGFKNGWTPSSTASATYNVIEVPPIQMIYVPGGSFTMGDTRGQGYPDELPSHTVTLNSFYIGKYEVTQAEYSILMPDPGWVSDYGLGANYPAYNVTWYAAIKYCNLRSMAEGLTPCYTIGGSTNPANWGAVPNSQNSTWDAAICNWQANGYRLPTEAEWEYAARGRTNNPDYLYSGSDDINAVAWYGSNSGFTTHPVGTKAPNGIGTYDMSGNVWEWCWDRYDESYYASSPQNNPRGPSSGSSRLWRGGCWGEHFPYCRVSYRFHYNPYSGYYCSYGFRLCRVAN